MTLQISADNSIIIDNKDTGLKLTQTETATVVYRPQSRFTGQKYEVLNMPHPRYSTSHDAPNSSIAGLAQLEIDILSIF